MGRILNLMWEEVMKLELIVTKLEQVSSLLNCLCENYFEKEQPDSTKLVAGYEQYTNIIQLLQEVIKEQTESLSEIFEKLLAADK